MSGPSVIVDLDKIEHNARSVVGMCGDHGISVSAVSKVTCGMPRVAKALLRGGACGIGESRLENVHRLRSNGVVAEMMLLRIPPLSGTDEIVQSVDISLNSELTVIRSLSRAAQEHGIVHNVLMMIDLGDLREGFWPDDVLAAAREIVELPHIKLKGVGTNLTCYGGVIPTKENMGLLADWARRIEDATGVGMEIVSGGNTSSLPLVASGKMPREINHLRIGEGILLGRDTLDRSPLAGTVQDAFRLEAEIIELKKKPSIPLGATGQDAFGRTPSFEDRGERLRAILNLGREDVDVEGLVPVEGDYRIIGASSDHLLVDVGPAAEGNGACGSAAGTVALGDTLEFIPNYSALLAAMTSSYVEKRTTGGGRRTAQEKKLRFFGPPLSDDPDSAFFRSLKSIGYSVDLEPAGEDTFRRELAECVREGHFPIITGTPHRTVEGFTAFAEALGDPGLLWISPYASISRPPSGASGSGALGLLLEEAIHTPATDNLVLVGLREADEGEAEVIRRLGITAFTMEDVDQLGIQGVIRKALQRAVVGTDGLYIYFDERLSDNGQEGLTTRETHMMMELIARTGFMRALDVSGVQLGGRSRRKLCSFVSSALGKRILG